MNWIGSDQIRQGMRWVGFDRMALDRIGLNGMGLDWMGWDGIGTVYFHVWPTPLECKFLKDKEGSRVFTYRSAWHAVVTQCSHNK